MKYSLMILFVLSTLAQPLLGQVNKSSNNANVQMAILLDTSGSMNGLIEQAKAQLWNIVNDLTKYKNEDEDISFEIALYEYGTGSVAAYQDYLRQVVPFTSDMDLISDQLFRLTTGGSQEYCGTVIHRSLKELAWSSTAGLKAIYIAGNESFVQGRYPYRTALAEAREQSVIVNTIFCGDYEQGLQLFWNTAAVLAKGNYTHIDHNRETVHINSPYDDEILRLNQLLNQTYLHYGSHGNKYRENQILQDNNANVYGKSNYVNRSIYKSKKQYKNEQWDLVDAYEADAAIIEEKEQLPAELKGKSDKEIKQQIETMKRERLRIQGEIECLAKEREAYVAEKKQELEGQNGLESSIVNSLGKEMEKAGYSKQ